MTARARTWLAVACLIIPALVVGIGWVSLSARLPTRMATHWTSLTHPDGFSDTTTFSATCLAITLAGLGVGVALAIAPMNRRSRAGLLGLIGFATALFSSVWLTCALIAAHADSPDRAALGGWIAPAIAFGILGGAPALIAPHEPAGPPHTTPEPLDLAPQANAAWRRRLTSRTFLVLGTAIAAVLLLVAGALALAGPGAAAVTMSIIAVTVLVSTATLASIEVTADARGLRVRSTALGLPLRRIPLSRIDEVYAERLRPLEWGGWGWRWKPGRTAVVLRAGDGIVVRTGQHAFAVTVDDAETGARVLETLRTR